MPPRRRKQNTEGAQVPDSFVIDFSDVEELDDSMLPNGDYLIEVERAELGKSDEGKPFLQLRTTILEGPEGTEGRKLSDRVYLNKDALWRAKKCFRAFGFDVSGQLDAVAISTDIVGKQADVLVTQRRLPRDKRLVANISRYYDPNEDEDADDWTGFDEKSE